MCELAASLLHSFKMASALENRRSGPTPTEKNVDLQHVLGNDAEGPESGRCVLPDDVLSLFGRLCGGFGEPISCVNSPCGSALPWNEKRSLRSRQLFDRVAHSTLADADILLVNPLYETSPTIYWRGLCESIVARYVDSNRIALSSIGYIGNSIFPQYDRGSKRKNKHAFTNSVLDTTQFKSYWDGLAYSIALRKGKEKVRGTIDGYCDLGGYFANNVSVNFLGRSLYITTSQVPMCYANTLDLRVLEESAFIMKETGSDWFNDFDPFDIIYDVAEPHGLLDKTVFSSRNADNIVDSIRDIIDNSLLSGDSRNDILQCVTMLSSVFRDTMGDSCDRIENTFRDNFSKISNKMVLYFIAFCIVIVSVWKKSVAGITLSMAILLVFDDNDYKKGLLSALSKLYQQLSAEKSDAVSLDFDQSIFVNSHDAPPNIFGCGVLTDDTDEVAEPHLGFSDIGSLLNGLLIIGLFQDINKCDFEKITRRLGNIPRAFSGVDSVINFVLTHIQKICNIFTDYYGKDRVILMKTGIDACDNYIKSTQSFFKKGYFCEKQVSPADVEFVLRKRIEGMELMGKYAHTDANLRSILMLQISDLNKLLSRIENQSLDGCGIRVRPVALMLHGAPQVGKSYNVYPLACTTLGLHDPSKADLIKANKHLIIGARQSEIKHWEGVVGFPVTVYDDLGQLRDSQSNPNRDYLEIIRNVNCFPSPCEMAGMVNKGNNFFHSKLVIATSNTCSHNIESIVSSEAFLARWDFHVHVVPARQFCTDETRDATDISKRRLDPRKIVPGVNDLDVQEFWWNENMPGHCFNANPSLAQPHSFDELACALAERMKDREYQYHKQCEYIDRRVEHSLSESDSRENVIRSIIDMVDSTDSQVFQTEEEYVNAANFIYDSTVIRKKSFVREPDDVGDIPSRWEKIKYKLMCSVSSTVSMIKQHPIAICGTIASVLLAGLGAYGLYKNVFEHKNTQHDIATPHFGSDCASDRAKAVMANNYFKLFADGVGVVGSILGVSRNVILMPHHYTGCGKALYFYVRGKRVDIDFAKAWVPKTMLESDLCLVVVDPKIQFRDCVRHMDGLKTFRVGMKRRVLLCGADSGDVHNESPLTVTAVGPMRSTTSSASIIKSQRFRSGCDEWTLSNCWRYSFPSKPGMCGDLLFDFNTGHLIGMHTGGSSGGVGFGISSTLCWEQFSDIKIATAHMGSKLSVIKPSPIVPVSSLRKTPLYSLFGPSKFKPARLQPFERDGVFYDPYKLALAKYQRPLVPIDLSYFELASHNVLQTFIGSVANFSQPRLLTFEEAVAGIPGNDFVRAIPRNTSSGYPWCLEYKDGKKSMFGFDGDFVFDTEGARAVRTSVDIMLETCRSGVVPEYFFMDVLKDEVLPNDSVDKGKARLVSASPIDATIVGRILFGMFNADWMSGRIINCSAVGINVYSEWDLLYRELTSVGKTNCIAGDYSRYDGSHRVEIFDIFVDRVNEYYQTSPDHDPRDDIARRMYVRSLSTSNHIRGTDTCKWDRGMPSGCPITTIANTFIGICLTQSAFLVEGVSRNFKVNDLLNDFNNYVRHIQYGDDDLTIVHDRVAWFDQEVKTSRLAELDYIYTDDNKGVNTFKFRHISDVNFLKRHFRFDPDFNLVVGPLSLDSAIQKPLYWVQRGLQSESIPYVNIARVLMELSLHGKGKFDEYASNLLRIADEAGYPPRYRSWAANFKFSLGQDYLWWA
jgi:hypothetical protein